MKYIMGIVAVALSTTAITAVAGDLTVEGNLHVNSSVTCQNLAATNATVNSLAVRGSVLLPSGSIGTNAAITAEWNAWADRRFLPSSGASSTDLILGAPGRIVSGDGVNVTNCASTAYGATQLGANYGVQKIGEMAAGASQRSYNSSSGTQTIGEWATGASQNSYNDCGTQTIEASAAGASQDGYNSGTQIIRKFSTGAKQSGRNDGTQTVWNHAYGSSQNGYNAGTEVIGDSAFGATQRGMVNYSACATNNGIGSVQLLNLAANQKARMTGHASIGLGACTVTNDQAIVAGDGLVSRGKGTVTANSFYGSGAGLTNLNLAAYVGSNLAWSGNKLQVASTAVFTSAKAVAAVTAVNLNMNAHRVTGLANATAATDAVNLQTSTNLIQQALLNVGPFGNLSMGAFTAR